jgi:hypothetical protein
MVDINFEWWVDEAGYHLVDAEPDKPEKLMEDGREIFITTLNGIGRPQHVIANGGRRRPTQPLKHFASLYKDFANLKTPEEVLRFINKYGYLTEFNGGGDDVPVVLRHAKTLRGWLDNMPRKKLAAWIGNEGKWVGRLSAELIVDSKGALRLRIIPNSLLGAIWIQMAYSIAGGITIRGCLHCGQWFEAGQGSRRLDAKFCSKEHQRQYNSLKRSL